MNISTETAKAILCVLSAAIVKEMHDWVKDCAVDGLDAEEREQADMVSVIRYTSREYAGGLGQFLIDNAEGCGR